MCRYLYRENLQGYSRVPAEKTTGDFEVGGNAPLLGLLLAQRLRAPAVRAPVVRTPLPAEFTHAERPSLT
jgi:hypothetical protein